MEDVVVDLIQPAHLILEMMKKVVFRKTMRIVPVSAVEGSLADKFMGGGEGDDLSLSPFHGG